MRHLIDPMDFTVEETADLMRVAQDIKANPGKYKQAAAGKILGTLFFEASTRTRLSFESAMISMGGSVIGFETGESSSYTKGESIADTIRVVSAYADICAMRHPKEGSAYVAAQYSGIPVINAGDGGHQHPTQTLGDLMTIMETKKRLKDLKIGVCGDLKFGRTVHSLIKSLSRYEGIKFYLVSPKELSLPGYIVEEVLEKQGIEYTASESLEKTIGEMEILYMTRVQRERFFSEDEYIKLKDRYILDKKKLMGARKELAVMHPLPRVNEIATDVDSDPRAVYFEQVKYGKYMRMALIIKLLSESEVGVC